MWVCIYTYLGAELEMFGSSANGFGSKGSDLDICLTLPGHDKVYTPWKVHVSYNVHDTNWYMINLGTFYMVFSQSTIVS